VTWYSLVSSTNKTEILLKVALNGDDFYNIKRKIYKKDFAELPFVNVVFDRMVMIYMEFVIFSLFAMHLDYCNIQRVSDQLDRN
jgi:hypothetical protein